MWVRGLNGFTFIQPTDFYFEKSPGKGEKSEYTLFVSNASSRMMVGRSTEEVQAKSAADALWELIGTDQKMTAQELMQRLGLKAE